MMMKRIKHLFPILLVAVFVACGTTSKVPVTGRKHSLLVNDEQILSLSKQEYSKFLKGAKLSSNAAQTAMVKRVGQRIISSTMGLSQNSSILLGSLIWCKTHMSMPSVCQEERLLSMKDCFP